MFGFLSLSTGNQGLMDILDMPNTNKYTFEGWVSDTMVLLIWAFCIYMLTELQTAKIIPCVAKINTLLLFEICSKYNLDYYLTDWIARFNVLHHNVSLSLCACRANPVWLDPFCRNLELAAQAEHEDDLPEDLSDITDLWNSPARTHVINSQKHCQNHAMVHVLSSSQEPTPSLCLLLPLWGT